MGGPSPRKVRTVWIAVGALLGAVFLWRMGGAFLGNDRGVGGLPTGETPNVSTSGSPGASGEPLEGTVTTDFPKPATGARLELKIFGLGDDPQSCKPAGMQIGGDVRTVYHFDCTGSDIPQPSPYFFLAKLTNLTRKPVPVDLNEFSVSETGGGTLSPLDTTNATYARVFQSTTLGFHASVKGWVTFDGTSAFVPSSISYVDGGQTLTVRFRGEWVRS